MSYEDIVNAVRETFEHADARRVFEHIAFEIDIIGEVTGAFYFEVAERACVIEPYNYYDNDGVITATPDMLMKLAKKEVHIADAVADGSVKFSGNERKLRLCTENIILP